MKTSIYSSPLRVYICLGALAIAGLIAGSRLPVSLFPNSSKPSVRVSMSYGSSTPEEFLDAFGRTLETQLRAISTADAQVEKINSSYGSDRVDIDVNFKWGTPPETALKEVQLAVNSFSSRLPEEIRDYLWVWPNNENSGFFAASFYSPIRSLDALYDLLEPILGPKVAQIPDAAEAGLWNPSGKEVSIEIDPARMASLQLFPRDIARAVNNAMGGQNGGSITVGTQQLNVQLPREIRTPEEMGKSSITLAGGKIIHLADIAKVDFGLKSRNSRSFKTSGAPSLILFATPKPGGNVKRMSEDLLAAVQSIQPQLPHDIQYKVLVDPSEFIRSAVNNVFHEVAIGAFLAVCILFLFIGSFKNTVTAAVEIPLSMILAFILMKFSGMNLNLISLGGLALSAGMNVDASVVVMENIFRHFETQKTPLDYRGRLNLITRAVSEVRFAVIASTVSSLVVFLPLAFTSELSYAILGDLAKTVVFSHGLSMFVALILVPTVRLQLMSKETDAHTHSPVEKWILKIERGYSKALGYFIGSHKLQLLSYAFLGLVLAGLCVSVLPKLPTEIIGKPDTDWMFLSAKTKGNTLIKQMESQSDQIEAQLLAKLGPKIQYTFTQTQDPNSGFIMARLKNKKDMQSVWKEMEALFTNTPYIKFWVGPWNPAELPIPDPAPLEISVRGGTLKERAEAAQEINHLLEEKHVFDRIWTKPEVEHSENIQLGVNLDFWASRPSANPLTPVDLAELSRVATTGKRIASLTIQGRLTDVVLRFPEGSIQTVEDLGALPIGINGKLVPLRALARVDIKETSPTLYRENERDLVLIYGKHNEGSNRGNKDSIQEARKILNGWKPKSADVIVSFEDGEKDLHHALRQLAFAVGLSILLIFITLVLQFGSVMNAFLVLVAVPLGIIGVIASLWVFKSTLSLNSVLGIILLNGIAVANSIILVDFLKRLVDQGMQPTLAAMEAGKKRLRPILITSMTTILGMLPIALGLGEGGKILQPLGIAVSGGLWVSMAFTLFVVPALQVRYLNWNRQKTKPRTDRSEPFSTGLKFEDPTRPLDLSKEVQL